MTIVEVCVQLSSFCWSMQQIYVTNLNQLRIVNEEIFCLCASALTELTYFVSRRFDSSSSAHYPLRRGCDDPLPVTPSTRAYPADGLRQGERSPAQARTQIPGRVGPTQCHERQQERVLHLTCGVRTSWPPLSRCDPNVRCQLSGQGLGTGSQLSLVDTASAFTLPTTVL